MKREIWKSVPGYTGLYEVSSLGRVRSFHGQSVRILSTPPTAWGYPHTNLTRDRVRETWTVHKMALCAFRGQCPKGMQAAHLNGNKRDARIDNLAWVTPTVNNSHKIRHGTQPYGASHWNAKLSERQARLARLLRETGMRQRAIAKRLGVCEATVSMLLSGRTWRHLSR